MVVTASGNLALIYLATTPGRVPLEEIELLHPKLIPGLATHPGVGFVVVDSLAEGPVAIGRTGVHVLRSGRIEGDDPLTRVRAVRGGVDAAAGRDAAQRRHRGGQPAGRVHPRGGGVRGAGRLPRRDRRLADRGGPGAPESLGPERASRRLRRGPRTADQLARRSWATARTCGNSSRSRASVEA